MNEYKLSKAEFREEKKKQRLALFKIANEQLDLVTDNPSSLLDYLKLMALIGYNPTNSLLVFSVNPKATLVKDYSRWRELGAFPKKATKGIPILEPSKEYTKRDGTSGVNYNVKHVFDITQTTYDIESPSLPSIESLIKAITYKDDIQIEYLDNTSHLNKSICFNKSSNTISIQKGLPNDDIIRGLLREFVLMNAAFLNNEHFEMSCVLYMLSIKYGIESVNTKFSLECSDYFRYKDSKNKKEILKNIKFVFDSICKRINNGLYTENYYQEMENNDYA